MAKAKDEVAKSKTAKKPEKPETVQETNLTEAAVHAAEQEAAVIAEKRPKAQTPSVDAEPQTVKAEKPLAKAGKRSAKSVAESEEKLAKEKRKVETKAEEATEKPKVQAKPPRSKLERRGKKYRKAAELIETGKLYNVSEGVALVAKTSPVKFDAGLELHVNLGVDPKQADQNVRDTVVLPAGTGKSIRVAVFADVDDVAAAKKAGADIAGGEEFLQQLDKGKFDFDVLIATPAMMPKLGKYARALGPKGLMPNPKSGTVTPDVKKAVTEAKAGRVEYRVDSTGIVHVGFGKVSFGPDKLLENASAILKSIKANKPASIKGNYITSVHLTTTMGPSVKIDLASLNNI